MALTSSHNHTDMLQWIANVKPTLHTLTLTLTPATFDNQSKVSRESLAGEECLAVVESLAAAISLDISQIEAKHSSNREMSLMRARGWFPSLLTLASAFICKTFTTLSGGRFDTTTNDQNTTGDDSKRKPKRTMSKRGGGGAWRAFVHSKLSGGARVSGHDFTRLAQEYRNLSPDEKTFYENAGRRGAQAHAAGFSSFGEKPQVSSARAMSQRLTAGSTDMSSGDAIIALDPATMLRESLQYSGSHTFETRFDLVKQQINTICKNFDPNMQQKEHEGGQLVLQAPSEPTQMSKTDQAILADFHAKSSEDHFVKNDCQHHSSLAAGFISIGGGIVGLNWVAPIKSFLQVGYLLMLFVVTSSWFIRNGEQLKAKYKPALC